MKYLMIVLLLAGGLTAVIWYSSKLPKPTILTEQQISEKTKHCEEIGLRGQIITRGFTDEIVDIKCLPR